MKEMKLQEAEEREKAFELERERKRLLAAEKATKNISREADRISSGKFSIPVRK